MNIYVFGTISFEACANLAVEQNSFHFMLFVLK